MSEIKNCPFCAGTDTTQDGHEDPWIECRDCDARAPISTWNMRAPKDIALWEMESVNAKLLGFVRYVNILPPSGARALEVLCQLSDDAENLLREVEE